MAHSQTHDFMKGALVGAACGVVIGSLASLLLAPQSGEELRETLGDKYEEIRDKAAEYVTEINGKGHEAIDKVRDWKETLVTLLDRYTDGKSKKGVHLDEVAEWASLGLQLIQQLQKRR